MNNVKVFLWFTKRPVLWKLIWFRLANQTGCKKLSELEFSTSKFVLVVFDLIWLKMSRCFTVSSNDCWMIYFVLAAFHLCVTKENRRHPGRYPESVIKLCKLVGLINMCLPKYIRISKKNYIVLELYFIYFYFVCEFLFVYE